VFCVLGASYTARADTEAPASSWGTVVPAPKLNEFAGVRALVMSGAFWLQNLQAAEERLWKDRAACFAVEVNLEAERLNFEPPYRALTTAMTTGEDRGAERPRPEVLAAAFAYAHVEDALVAPKIVNEALLLSVLESPARTRACLEYREAILKSFREVDAKAASNGELAAARAQETDRERAHFDDVLRKAAPLFGTLVSSSGRAERPGAPDTIAAAIMTAAGADRASDGTNLLFTFNLAGLLSSLAAREPGARTTSPAYGRHLFFQLGLPLGGAEAGISSSPSAAQSSAAAPSTNALGGLGSLQRSSPVSMVLGGSLLDDSDPRLSSNDECYRVVDALTPRSAVFEPAAMQAALESRKPLYRACHEFVANRHRLAWRVAARLEGAATAASVSVSASAQTTRLELVGASVVWAPVSSFTLSPFLRRTFMPVSAYEVGLAVSVGKNLWNRMAGAKAFCRVAIDAVVVYDERLARSEDRSPGRLRLQLVPSVSFPLVGDAVVSLAVGPTIDWSRADAVGLLASAALSYDIDRVAAALLSP
jgi:hypothetical protein